MRKPSTWLLLIAILAAGVWNFTAAQQQGNPVVIYGIGPVTTITTTLPVSGSVGVNGNVAITAASLPLPSGAATDATLTALGIRVLGSNLVQVATTAVDTNHGNVSAGTQRVVLPDNIIVPHNLVQVGTTAVSVNSGTLDNGTQRFALATNQLALTVAPVMTINANQQITAGNGCTPYHLSGGTGASTNSNNIKATAATLCDILPINVTSTVYYIKLYDTNIAPTCSVGSSATLKHVYPIPNASGAGGGFSRPLPLGEEYHLGIGYCVTGGGGDTDNTNAATGVYIEASYK